jgi:DNA-binding response OmpR family regulator
MARILLVEDEEAVRSLLKEVLEYEGYEVKEASNGEEALRWYAQSSADLVLTDIVMPDMEGIEMIMKIRKTDLNVKIIVMSGNDYLDLARKLGADYALRKPFSNQVLLDAVKATLDS